MLCVVSCACCVVMYEPRLAAACVPMPAYVNELAFQYACMSAWPRMSAHAYASVFVHGLKATWPGIMLHWS